MQSAERFEEYLGLDYEGASREASRLIASAHKTGEWISKLPRWQALAQIMDRHLAQTSFADDALGRSIFSTFDVNVPMPAGTKAARL